MSAIKLLKIIQKESGPFTPLNNLCSIDFEPGNCTDLSRSYLDIDVTFTDQNGAPPEDQVYLGDNDTGAKYFADCFIRHATLRSDTKGLIEQQRFNNIYSQTTKQYFVGSEADKASVSLGNNEVSVDADGNGNVIVPLSKILGAANAPMLYPDYMMGQTRLELELESTIPLAYGGGDNTADFTISANNAVVPAGQNLTQVVITQPMSAAAASVIWVSGRVYDFTYRIGTNNFNTNMTLTRYERAANNGIVTLTFTLAVNTGAGNITNITIASANDTNTFTCTDIANASGAAASYATITAINAAPGDFTVGQQYTIFYLDQTTAGLAPGDTYYSYSGYLKSAVANQGTPANCDLTFEDSIVLNLPNNHTATDISILGHEDREVFNWTITRVSLVQAKPVMEQKVSMFQFQTNLLEMVNIPAGVNQFRRQIELEVGTDLVCCINPIAQNLLGASQFDTYRNSVNSIDTITKDVTIDFFNNSSLYFDRLLYAYDSMIKRLNPYNGTIAPVAVTMIPERITPEQALEPQNVIEFRLTHTVGPAVVASIAYFYKRNLRTFTK